MGDEYPTLELWRNLYDAAMELGRTGPWGWMWDRDMFGVEDPKTKQVGYCCIMGRAGKHFGVAVYLGTEGLEGYLKCQSGEVGGALDEVLFAQKCLMVSFEDRELLEKKDLETIKSLGLKFRGQNSWPQFRSYRPGFLPWFLTQQEAECLSQCIPQVIDVSLRFKKNRKLLEPVKKGAYLVRVTREGSPGALWRDEWLEPSPMKKQAAPSPSIDEDLLKKAKSAAPTAKGTWEVELAYFPAPVREKGARPYFPLTLLCMDHDSGFLMSSEMAPPDTYVSYLTREFLKLVQKNKQAPKQILVRTDRTLQFLEPIASRMGIELKVRKDLPRIADAVRSMREFITGRPEPGEFVDFDIGLN